MNYTLREAIERAERGLVDADPGGGVIKQRAPRTGRGRSGGYRLLVAYRSGDRAVLLHGLAINERDNITDDELATLRDVGRAWLDAEVGRLEHAMKEGVLQESSDADEAQDI